MFRVLAFATAGLICALPALFDIAVAAGLWIDGRIDELGGDVGFFAFIIAAFAAAVFFLMRAKQLYGGLLIGGTVPTMKDRAATPMAVTAILSFFTVLSIWFCAASELQDEKADRATPATLRTHATLLFVSLKSASFEKRSYRRAVMLIT